MSRLIAIALTVCSLIIPLTASAAHPAADGDDGRQAAAASRRRQRARQLRRSRKRPLRRARPSAHRRDTLPSPASQPAQILEPEEEYRLGDPRANRPRVRRPSKVQVVPDIKNPGPPPAPSRP